MSETIGLRLEQELRRLGTLSSTHRAINVNKNTLYNWINRNNVPADQLAKLGALGVDTHYVITGNRINQTSNHHLSTTAPQQAQAESLAVTIRLIKAALITALSAIERAEAALQYPRRQEENK